MQSSPKFSEFETNIIDRWKFFQEKNHEKICGREVKVRTRRTSENFRRTSHTYPKFDGKWQNHTISTPNWLLRLKTSIFEECEQVVLQNQHACKTFELVMMIWRDRNCVLRLETSRSVISTEYKRLFDLIIMDAELYWSSAKSERNPSIFWGFPKGSPENLGEPFQDSGDLII